MEAAAASSRLHRQQNIEGVAVFADGGIGHAHVAIARGRVGGVRRSPFAAAERNEPDRQYGLAAPRRSASGIARGGLISASRARSAS
jgi:hypothetical protein